MTVRIDKGEPQAVGGFVSLRKESGPGNGSSPGTGWSPTEAIDEGTSGGSRTSNQPRTPSGDPSSDTRRRRRFGRVAMTAAFVAGTLLSGLAAGSLAAARGADLANTRSELSSADSHIAKLRSHLTDTAGDLKSTTAELTAAQSRADEVAARATALKEQESELHRRATAVAQREKAVAKREKAAARKESSLESRENALKSYDVGHPLLDSIMDDGTWVVGRDIKAGTWSASADDTGCTWRTSDGRQGAGNGSYNEMRVNLSTGQTFTVHGCTEWDNFGF